MSNTTHNRATLLTNLRNAVWGNQIIFKRQLNLSDHETGYSSTVDYLDFGEYLTEIKVIVPTVRIAQLLVCEEYRHAVETFEKDGVYNGGACIMGQPGIGKSCFIAYAVIERLRKKQPIAVQILPESNNECYALFSADGVSLHHGSDIKPLWFHKGIWALSDSKPGAIIPAVAFRTMLGVRVFQTTLPEISHWKEWTKQNMIRRYIMNVWSSEEITALAVLLKIDVKRMNDLASRWGPVPCTLLQIFTDDDQEPLFSSYIRSAASEAIPDCRNILCSLVNLGAPVNPEASYIFFIRPKKTRGTVSRQSHTIYIPTQTIAETLAAAVCNATEGDRQDFFNAMIAFPGTCTAAGFIFEIWIHSFLASRNPIQCSWGKASKSLPSTLPLASQTVYTNDELRRTTPPFYWKAPPNFPGIDGALFAERDVYVIQINVSRKYSVRDPQPGLNELRRLLGEKKTKKLRWRVLFIGNKHAQSKTQSWEYIDKLYIDTGGGGIIGLRKPKAVPVGWCAPGPLNTEITVVKTLTSYVPLESDGDTHTFG